MFLTQEVGAFRNNTEKKQQKSRPKLKKNIYVTYLQIIFALSAI